MVAGEKPTDTPSLADDAAEFKKLNDELFGDGSGVHSVGKGKVYAGQNADAALKALNVAPDFDYTKPESDTRILFVHRKLADADIYFLDNRNDRDETVDASFRVTGKAPELWYAETGQSEPASYQHRRRPDHGSAASRTVGHGVRGVPQARQGEISHLAQAGGDASWRPWMARGM